MGKKYKHGAVTQELILFPDKQRRTKVNVVWFEANRENPTDKGNNNAQ